MFRRISILLGVVTVVVSVLGLLSYYGPGDKVLQPVIGTLAAIGVTVGSLLVRQVREVLEEVLERVNPERHCTIVMYGHTGSGKTTLLKSLLFADTLVPERETEHFLYFRKNVSLDAETEVPVMIADYKGEEPDQAIFDLEEEFAGQSQARQINAMLLLVDLIPRFHDEKGQPLDDEPTLDKMKLDADKIIAERVRDHDYYFAPAMLRVTSVRL